MKEDHWTVAVAWEASGVGMLTVWRSYVSSSRAEGAGRRHERSVGAGSTAGTAPSQAAVQSMFGSVVTPKRFIVNSC